MSLEDGQTGSDVVARAGVAASIRATERLNFKARELKESPAYTSTSPSTFGRRK